MAPIFLERIAGVSRSIGFVIPLSLAVHDHIPRYSGDFAGPEPGPHREQEHDHITFGIPRGRQMEQHGLYLGGRECLCLLPCQRAILAIIGDYIGVFIVSIMFTNSKMEITRNIQAFYRQQYTESIVCDASALLPAPACG